MRFLCFILVLVSSAACSSAQDPVARGRARFVGLGCSACHRVGGQGGGQVGPDLTTVGLRHSADWLDRWMKDPKGWKPDTTMPAYKLKDEVRAELVAYLLNLTGDAYRQNPPWNAGTLRADPEKRGEMIYNRVGCAACHGPRGAGGFPNNNVVGNKIPSLTFARDGFSREELKDRIALGRRPEPADRSQPAPLIEMPAWGRFLAEDEMKDLISYLYSLRPAPKPGDQWDQ
jgi:mono/diheme cytochrome c family protein